MDETYPIYEKDIVPNSEEENNSDLAIDDFYDNPNTIRYEKIKTSDKQVKMSKTVDRPFSDLIRLNGNPSLMSMFNLNYELAVPSLDQVLELDELSEIALEMLVFYGKFVFKRS